MGTLKQKTTTLFLLIFLWSNPIWGQELDEMRQDINNQTEFVNDLIKQLNININRLNKYQDDLNKWAESEDPQLDDAPFYSYYPFLLDDDYLDIKMSKTQVAVSGVFDYKEQLNILYKQSLLFNEFCKQLKNVTRAGSKVKYYEINMRVLSQIEAMSSEWVELSYDFSRACAVNFGRQESPSSLNKSSELIAKSKNLIMSLRTNNTASAITFLNQLDVAIFEAQDRSDVTAFKNTTNLKISEKETNDFITNIVIQSNAIAAWGEQYLQSNKSLDETNMILQNAVKDFNFSTSRDGNATAYNRLLDNTDQIFLKYTEEPLAFNMKNLNIQILEDEAIQDEILALDTLSANSGEINSAGMANTGNMELAQEIEMFDAEDYNSLTGALPSNMIILMDVSVSMKLNGLLPNLKSAIEHLADILRPQDRISLIAYSGEAEVLIANASIGNRSNIQEVLDTLASSGGTDMENAMNMAFTLVELYRMPDGNNRIIIASDGIFGVNANLLNQIEIKANEGISTSVFHFVNSKSNKALSSLERITEIGGGSYSIIENSDQAKDALVAEAKKQRLN